MQKMRKKIVLFLMSFFLLLVMFRARFITTVMAESAIIRVPADYSTIQGAVDAANPGDVILVMSGIYCEHITVDKPLTLVGENRSDTIIDSKKSGDVVCVTADNVIIDGFTIRNGDQGIELLGGSNTISSNIITLNYWGGIMLYETAGNIISNNHISSNGHGPPLGSMFGGIGLLSSSDNVISDNTLMNNTPGDIFLMNSNNNTIIGNSMGSLEVFAFSNSRGQHLLP